MKKLALPLVMAALVVMGAIGSVHAATCNGTFTGLTPNLANGQTLVAANGNCASCHAVPTGTSATAIYGNVSLMSFMSSWSCQNFVDVAAALAPVTGSGMPLPTSEEVFPYDPVADPVTSTDPGQAMPIGLGAVATGGDTLTLHITANFQSAVNIYVSMYTPSAAGFTPVTLKMLNKGGKFVSPMSTGALKIKKWQTGVTSVDETILNAVPLSTLKKGVYYVVMTATPTTGNTDYYQWITFFIVQ